jgi:hypothetical protein
MNRRHSRLIISALCVVFIYGLSAAEDQPIVKTWPKEKAWQWYNTHPWINGCNYLPSYAGNSTEFWQADTFDPRVIDRELTLAAGLGYNSVRVLMQYMVWENNPESYKARFAAFLELARKHGISVMPQFFDDCAFGLQPDKWKRENPYLGKQDDPIPGVFFPNWAPSPGHSRVTDISAWPRLKKYMLDFMGTFKDDKRILAWDLYNEPSGGNMGGKTIPLLKEVFLWAREIDASQPVTSGLWNGDNAINSIILKNSDIITFHQYPTPDPDRFKETGRPVICTEWMIRTGPNIHNDIFAKTLPGLKEKKIGSYSWGLVNGRSQAQFPWGSQPGTPEPKIWFTDIFRDIQGTAYDQDEIDAIRKVSGIAGKDSAQPSSAGDGKPAPGKQR